MAKPAISNGRTEWTRKLTVEDLILIREKFPDAPQAPLATTLSLHGCPGELVTAVWQTYVDQRLIDAVTAIDAMPATDRIGDVTRADLIAQGVADAGFHCGHKTGSNGETVFTVTHPLDGRATEVRLIDTHFENFDDASLIQTVRMLAEAGFATINNAAE